MWGQGIMSLRIDCLKVMNIDELISKSSSFSFIYSIKLKSEKNLPHQKSKMTIY